MDRERLAIWLKTLAVVFAYVASIALVHLYVTSRWIGLRWLSIAVTFSVLQLTFSVAILAFVYLRRRVVEVRRSIGIQVLPQLREALALQSAGEDRADELKSILKRFPYEFELALFEFLQGLRGGDRDRVRQLAISFGMVERWTEAYRTGNLPRRRIAVERLASLGTTEAIEALEDALKDLDPTIRLRASRALLARGGGEDVEKIYRFSLLQAPVVRALAAEDLKPFLLGLASKAVPEALRSGDAQQALGALDMIWAWGRMIDVPEAVPFIDHEDSLVRAVAIRACRYAAPQALRGRIPDRLADPAAVVRRAAAEAAGGLGLEETIPALKACLADADERVARSAARSLAGFGEKGLRLLDDAVLTAPDAVAAVALESVEKARLGRLDWES